MRVKILESYLKNMQGKKVLLYVSSGPYKKEYLSLPYDYVVLTDKIGIIDETTNPQIELYNNKVVMMSMDTNRALRILKENGVKIQCFVGIRDGCNEGGNYECVNTNSFFGRLSPILDNKVYYITDHFDYYRGEIDPLLGKLGFMNVNYENTDSFDDSLLFDESVFFNQYFNSLQDITVIPIQRKDPQTIERMIGKIKVSVSHASVWDYESDLDCIIHGELTHEGNENYFQLKPHRTYLSVQNIIRVPEYILAQAQLNKWKKIGLIPFMNGQYNGFIEACLNWNAEYPEKLHFFHLEDRDMIELRALIVDAP